MTSLIIFITIIGLFTLYFADKNIFNNIIKSFNKPKITKYTDKEIKNNGYLAIVETLDEIPEGCVMLPFLLILITIIMLFIIRLN